MGSQKSWTQLNNNDNNLSLYHWVGGVLYKLKIQVPYQIYNWKKYCLFILLMVSFAEQRILSLLISSLSIIFLFCCLCSWCHKRKYFLIQDLHLCFILLIFKLHTSSCHNFLYSFFWKSNSLYSFSMSPNWFFILMFLCHILN